MMLKEVLSLDASKSIDKQISDLGDWRGETVAQLRRLIHEADPNIEEQWKWGTGVWAHNGNVCAVGGFKNHIKINFFQGAALKDPEGTFNAGLDAKATRAIDFYEKDEIDEAALKDLIRAAVDYNLSRAKS